MTTNNIYIGNRYTPLFCGAWDASTSYESLSAVTYTDGNAYVSKKPVPAGIVPTNAEYWMMWGSGNAALDNVTQRLNTVENDVENLESALSQTQQNMPWKVSATLKGDGVTDNTLLFGALDPNTPIALLPGTYLITGNVTIPCAIQFIPGAVLKYNAATPGTNYVTVTFAKGFYVPDNTQIFDTYIIPKIGGNNATVNPKFSWYGGKESNNAQANDNIMAWLLSGGFGATEITIEPGTYAMSNMNNGAGSVGIGNHSVVINAYGVTFNSAIKTGNRAIIKGAKFTAPSGGVTTFNNSFIDCEFTCPVTDSDANGVHIGALFERCKFSNTVTTDMGTKFRKCEFTVNHSEQAITSAGTNDVVSIKDCVFDLGASSSATTSIIGAMAAGAMLLEGCRFRKQGNTVPPAFVVDIGAGFAFDNIMTIGKLKANTAINNVAYAIEAENQSGNIINQEIQPAQKQFIGYTLKSDADSNIIKTGVNNVKISLIAHYSDGTTEDLGEATANNKGMVRIVGTKNSASYYNGVLTINAGETPMTSCLAVFEPQSNSTLKYKLSAVMTFTIVAAG